jgi:hypothetical protein
MRRKNTGNPYSDFKDDDQRRRALNTRMICLSIVGVAFAVAGGHEQLARTFVWLKALLS